MPNENEIILERNWIFTFLFFEASNILSIEGTKQLIFPNRLLMACVIVLNIVFSKYFMCYRHYRRVILREIDSDLKAELAYITKAIKSHPKNYQVW